MTDQFFYNDHLLVATNTKSADSFLRVSWIQTHTHNISKIFFYTGMVHWRGETTTRTNDGDRVRAKIKHHCNRIPLVTLSPQGMRAVTNKPTSRSGDRTRLIIHFVRRIRRLLCSVPILRPHKTHTYAHALCSYSPCERKSHVKIRTVT